MQAAEARNSGDSPRVDNLKPSATGSESSGAGGIDGNEAGPGSGREALFPGDPYAMVSAPPDSVMNFAVAPFIPRGVDSITALAFTDRFRLSLSRSCPFPVLEPQVMEMILDQQQLHTDNFCDHNNCMIRMGRRLGVRYIIAGSAGKARNIFTFVIRMIDTRNGKVVKFYFEDIQRPLKEVLGTCLPEIAEQFSYEISRMTTVTLELKSDPEHATVSLNGRSIGRTPLQLKDLAEGRCVVNISRENYLPATDTFMLRKKVPVTRSYTLSFTDEYTKKVLAEKNAANVRMLQGAGVVGSIIAFTIGGYYNKRLDDIAAEQREIIKEYSEKANGTDFSPYKKRFDEQADIFAHLKGYRNVSYVFGIVFALGVSVTFFY
jgi:TolB-like protein